MPPSPHVGPSADPLSAHQPRADAPREVRISLMSALIDDLPSTCSIDAGYTVTIRAMYRPGDIS